MSQGLDQSTASVGEVLPFVWGRMYGNLLNAGWCGRIFWLRIVHMVYE